MAAAGGPDGRLAGLCPGLEQGRRRAALQDPGAAGPGGRHGTSIDRAGTFKVRERVECFLVLIHKSGSAVAG